MKISKRAAGNLLLVFAALIWGTAFVAQKKGVDILRPCTFNGIRTMLGCITLLPLIFFRSFSEKKKGTPSNQNTKTLIAGGIICGILLCLAGTVQTYGLIYADAGKAGFITALYIVLVPIFGIFIGRRLRPVIAVSVLIALFGLYLLCVKEGFGFGSFNKGDVMLLLCALLFSFHILAIDIFSPKVDGVRLSCIQFFVAAMLNIIYMFLVDKPEISDILSCWFPIFYAGVMSTGVAYTLQVVAQKNTDPSVASIIMSMESLFALFAGIAFGEQPTVRELGGCLLMLSAILLAQIPESKGRKI